MKKLALALLTSFVFVGGALAADQDTMTSPATSDPAAINQSTTTSQTQQGDDGQVLKVIAVINNNEIAAAKIAIQKAKDKDVKAYARQLQKDHSMNLGKVKKIAQEAKVKLADSDKSQEMKDKGQKEAQDLKTVDKADFDKTYMEAMEKGHQEVIDYIDNQLTPMATNQKVSDFLKNTRAKIMEHLQKAKDIVSKMSNTSGTSTDQSTTGTSTPSNQ